MKGRGGKGGIRQRIPKDVLVLAKGVAEGVAEAGASPAPRRAEAALTGPEDAPAQGTKTKIVNVLRKLHPMD